MASPPPSGSTDPSKPLREQAAVLRILLQLQPDVLGLSEMGNREDLLHLQAQLKSNGLDLPHLEHVEAADPVRHLALLSRFPLRSRQSPIHYRYLLDQQEIPVQRGFLDVTLSFSTGPDLRLIGAHLKSQRDVPEADQALMRRNEAHLLRQHLNEILAANPELPILVYGDLNEDRTSAGFKILRGMRGSPAALSEVRPTDRAGQKWTYYFPEADEYSRIDFCFASSSLLPLIPPDSASLYDGLDWNEASDHRPITVSLHLQEFRSKLKFRKTPQPPPGSPLGVQTSDPSPPLPNPLPNPLPGSESR